MKNKHYELAKMLFATVVYLRNKNEEPVDLNETFDTIDEERQQLLYDNIEHIIAHPDMTAEQEHDLWMKLKIEKGWVYGPETIRSKKIHNCIVPFKDLNIWQQLKDELVILITKSYLGL